MKSKRIYPEWFINDLAKEDDKTRAKNGSLSSFKKIEFICSKHGSYYQFVYSHIKLSSGEKKHGCPKCGIENQKTKHIETKKNNKKSFPEWFINDLAKEEDKTRALQKNISTKEKLTFFCQKHGEYTQSVGHHINIKTNEKRNGCPECGKEKRINNRKTTLSTKRTNYPEWFINDLAREEDKIKAYKKTLSSGDVVEFFCKKHGIYKQPVYNHIVLKTLDKKAGCPKCKSQKSNGEDLLFNFIKKTTNNVIRRCKTEIRNNETNYPMELDIYCPDKKIAFEFNGSLWHSENVKSKNYHFNKFKLCEEKGIRLISIFDKDWSSSNEKIKLFIKNILEEKTKIYGRKTIVKKIENKIANDFCKKYHIKNSGNGCYIAYGLFYNNELISVMTFSKPKYGKENNIEWDLKRYCVKYGFMILGGAAKLFAAFVKEYNPKTIITYSDCDYFSGEIYSSLGFNFNKYTSIPYYWSNGNISYSREQCQLKILKNLEPSLYLESLKESSSKEDYIMHKKGFYKVFRCGNKKWIWTESKR